MEVLVVSAVCLLAMFLIAGLFLWSSDAIADWWNRESPAEEQRRLAELQSRLETPNWRELEAHFRAPVPDDLRRLYETAFVMKEGLRFPNPRAGEPEGEEMIARFMPADLQTVRDASWVVGPEDFPFADDGLSNFYCVRFTHTPDRPSPVRIWWHEGREVETVADSLADFLEKATAGSAQGAPAEAAAERSDAPDGALS